MARAASGEAVNSESVPQTVIIHGDNSFLQSPLISHKANQHRMQHSGTIDGLDSVIMLKDDGQSVDQSEMQFTANGGVFSAIKQQSSNHKNNHIGNQYMNRHDGDSSNDGAHQYITSFHPPANIQGEETQELIEALNPLCHHSQQHQ